MQDFYREQMERNGFLAKTISLETESDGVTPKVHVVYAPLVDSYYRADPWGRVAPAAQAAGLPVWSNGQVWLGIFESHVMNPDGSLVGEYNGGGSYGSGSDAGLGITNSNTLAVATLDRLIRDESYNGLTIPELGSYPMVYGITAHPAEGLSLGEFASTRLGVVIHEVAHGFGLPHDFRNDANRFGNLMGNGFRGIHAWVHPNLYGNESETRLSYGNALALNVSRYFNGSRTYTDNTKPVLSVSSSVNGTIQSGNLEIPFSASDASGLSAAWLQHEGNLVGELPLSGSSVESKFVTAFYNTGSSNSYTVSVFDSQGNKQSQAITITVAGGANRAPRPHITIKPSVAAVGQQVVLSAQLSSDPDHSLSQLRVEWDLDGNGEFDTVSAPAVFQHITTYSTPGVYLVRVRISDSSGGVTISTPVGVRVTSAPSAVEGWGLY